MRENCLHSQCVCVCVCVSLDFWCSIVLYTGSNISTSGKNFIKITSVGMGAAKSNETK